MTQSRKFVEWAQNSISYTDSPESTVADYDTMFHGAPEENDSYPTGEERRWDREIETVWVCPDGSIAISRHWEPLQYDHGDGVEPNASWYVGEGYRETVTRYRIVTS